MLGCHDFCGYYEWTFHYLRRRFGNQALQEYWANSIAADSQQHYLDSTGKNGLQGLYRTWSKTGVDEECDWSVTLDEPNNLLRLDMRECPSKGFLIANDLNADEDYCDHCMGWIGPALHQIGAEVAAHEHNHCGQCWWEIRLLNEEQPPVAASTDIRRDPRWQSGYLDRFSHHVRLPIVERSDANGWADILQDWFRFATRLVALDMGSPCPTLGAQDALVVSGQRYAEENLPQERLTAVILDHDPKSLADVAGQFHANDTRPLLLHPYLPKQPKLNFAEYRLPRALPILPLLIQLGEYCHRPHSAAPSFCDFATMLARSLQKSVACHSCKSRQHAEVNRAILRSDRGLL